MRKLLIAAALAVLGAAGPASAQTYPSRTVSLIVPFRRVAGWMPWRGSSPRSFRSR